jgi:hypothetical protein
MALLNHFYCVALHILSSWCGAAHPFILPWHYCTQSFFLCGAAHSIFLVWRCASLHPAVALLNHFSCVALHITSSWCGAAHPFILMWCCTSLHPPVALLNYFSFEALHILSSSRGTAQ